MQNQKPEFQNLLRFLESREHANRAKYLHIWLYIFVDKLLRFGFLHFVDDGFFFLFVAHYLRHHKAWRNWKKVRHTKKRLYRPNSFHKCQAKAHTRKWDDKRCPSQEVKCWSIFWLFHDDSYKIVFRIFERNRRKNVFETCFFCFRPQAKLAYPVQSRQVFVGKCKRFSFLP